MAFFRKNQTLVTIFKHFNVWHLLITSHYYRSTFGSDCAEYAIFAAIIRYMVVYSCIHGACFGDFDDFDWSGAEVEISRKGDVRFF